MIDADDLSRWGELATNATEGPWAIWRDLDHQGFKTVGDAGSYEEVKRDGFTEESNPTAHVYIEEDAEFIAASRTAVPALLTEVESGRDRIAKLEAALAKSDAAFDKVYKENGRLHLEVMELRLTQEKGNND